MYAPHQKIKNSLRDQQKKIINKTVQQNHKEMILRKKKRHIYVQNKTLYIN